MIVIEPRTHRPRPPIVVRRYGQSGAWVVLVHGGPGVPGYLAPVARELSSEFRVIEPFQRGGGEGPVTVGVHIADLREVIGDTCGGGRVLVVGHSWGAMLALAYAAVHGDTVAGLVLVGCGTFDVQARERMNATLRQRGGVDLLDRLRRLSEESPDANEGLRAVGRLLEPVFSYDLLPHEDEGEPCDARAHHESWSDMLRLQGEGVYPASFAGIRVPAIMFHGTVDPHPGEMIYEGLRRFMPQLEYRSWERCGHYPWLEREARDEFYLALREWLRRHPA